MKALEKAHIASIFLGRSGVTEARAEVEQIIAHCLGISRMILYRDDPEIGGDAMERIEASVRRRAQREPLQYVLGYTEFLGLIIRVGPGVLIPRPETELLVEEAVSLIAKCATGASQHAILDLCTGSGCIALALAREFPAARVFGTDISTAAIGFAEENATLNHIRNATFLRGSFFEPLGRHPDVGISPPVFDIIVSNPPYVKTGDLAGLAPEVRDWEPPEALHGGNDGLDFYRTIIPSAREHLKPNGHLLFEIGIGQVDEIKKIVRSSGYRCIAVRKDYAGIDRIIALKK